MKVSINWLKELIELNCPMDELINLLPLRSISIKEVIENYIELDMKGYNRADLLSMRGVAYEVAAITGSKTLFREPEEGEFVWNQTKLPEAKVTVEDSKLCPFYSLTKIEGLQVGPSSKEWVEKLEASGMRSVDNITDITNLIMLEYGQPMHAFDSDSIGVDDKGVKDETIIVRTAKSGERITTLDGKTRDLKTSDLLIADSQNALGIAGVMGGKDSEVNDSTTTILLEAAIFDPINIKKTVTSLGLPSEASKRFQHGLTKIRLLQALNAAIKMYEQLDGKITAVTMVGPSADGFEDKVKKIQLTKTKLDDLVGINIKPEEVETYLTKLGFTLALQGETLRAWEVIVPYWRLDIELEEDLIEEVARMYGYEKIPPHEVRGKLPLQKEDPIFQKISQLRSKLVDLGLTEVQTYSFYTTQVIEAIGWNEQKDEFLVKIANPISAETEYLRQSIWANLVEVIGKNLRKGYKDIAIFEIGKAFNVDSSGNPKEDYRLAIALMNGTDNPIEELISMAKELGIEFKNSAPSPVAAHLFHPKRFMGALAEVHLRVLNKLGIEKRVAILEIGISA